MAPSSVLPRHGFIERLWLGFVFFLPLAFGPGLNDTFALAKATLLRCGCAFFFAVCADAAIRSGRIPLRHSSLNRPLLFFLVAVFVSLLGASFKSAAFWGMAGDFSEGWTSLLCFLFLFWFAASQLSEEQASKTLDAMLAAAGLVALYGLLQAAGFDLFVWRDGQAVFGRPWSTLGNPNFLGAFLAMSIPLALEALLARPGPGRATVAALVLALLPFTFSKAAGLAGSAGLAIWAWWRRESLGGQAKPLVRALLLAGAIALGLLVWRQRQQPNSPQPAASLVERILVQASPTASSFMGRLILWRTAAEMFLENPVLGIGPAGFVYHFRRWMDPEFETTLSAGLSSSHAHNEILNTAVSLGALGLAVYFWVVYRLLRLMARLCRRRAQAADPSVGGVVAALAAVWINNQFSFHTVTTAAYACVLMGLLVRHESPDRSLALPLTPSSGTGVRAAAYALGLAGFVLSFSFLVANRFNRLAEEAYKRGDWRAAIGLGRIASRLDPFSSAYHIGLGRLLQEGILNGQNIEESDAFFRDSVHQYEGVARRSPLNVLAQNGLGVTFIHAARRFGDPSYLAQAEQGFRRALAADPYFTEGISNLAGCLYLQGRKGEAVAVYQRAIERRPRASALHLNLGDLYAQEGLEAEAIAQWQRILRYDSSNEEAKRRLAQIWEKQVE